MIRPTGFVLSAAIVAIGLGLTLVTVGLGQAPVLPADLPMLIQVERKHIDAELAKSSFLKKGRGRVKMAAFMIAAYAQEAKKHALRDQALKLIKVAGTGKADEARKLAATLSLDFQGDPKAAHVGVVPPPKQLDLETVMRMFSGTRVGGFDMEKAIDDLGKAQALSAAQFERAALLGDKLGMIGSIAHGYAPKADLGKKTQKTWNELAGQMQAEAATLAAAAHAKKHADVAKAAKALMETCEKCHHIYR